MYLQKVICRFFFVIIFFFFGVLKVNDENPDPDPLVRSMDPRIRIHIKMSWIHNTGEKEHERSPDNSLNVFLICGQTFSPLRPLPTRFLCRGFLPPFKSRRRGGNDHDPLGIRAISVLFVSGSGHVRLAKTAVVNV
jgi:hypothetical protein